MRHVYTIRKHQRLKSRKDIASVFETGNYINQYPLKAVYKFAEGEPGLLVGVTASRKKLSKAVDRNRAKRLMREAWRLNSVSLRELLIKQGKRLHVFLIFTGHGLPEFTTVDKGVRDIISKLSALDEGHSLQSGR